MRYYIGMTIETAESSKEGLRRQVRDMLEREMLRYEELDIIYQPYPARDHATS